MAMTDARETAPETPSGDPLGMDLEPGTDSDEELGERGPYDADGVIEPEHDRVDDDDIAGERRDDDQP
jgi:hypothetical protein